MGGQAGHEEETADEQEEALRGDGYVHCPDGDGGSTGVNIRQNSSSWKL